MKSSSLELANSSRLPIQMGQLSERYNSTGVDVPNSDYTDEYIVKVMETLGVRSGLPLCDASVCDSQWIGPAWKARRPCPNGVVVL